MKKALFLALIALPSLAQNIEHQIIASQYNTWQVAGYAPDTYSFSPTACKVQGGASFFDAFTQGVPVLIRDGNPSLSEVVTPSLVVINNTTCTISIAPVNHHNVPFSIVSATGGLQEALIANAQNPGVNTIVLDNTWDQAAGSSASAIIAAAQGSYNLGLVHVTTLPYTWYQWNGPQYVPIAIGGVTSVFGRTGNVVAATGDYTCAQVTGCGAAYGFVNSIAATQSSSDTTLSLNGYAGAYPLTGVVQVDLEWESYTGISGDTLTGITRGYHSTTPAAHSAGANIMAVNLDFGVPSQPPSSGVFGFQNIGGGESQLLSVNCGFPNAVNYGGPLAVLQVNCGSPAVQVDSAGSIHQYGLAASPNYMGPLYISPSNASYPPGGVGLPPPITNTLNVAQTSAQQQFGYPVGYTAPIYGPLRVVPVPAIGAPAASGEFGGSCSITYDIVGVDADGNAVAGTPTAVTGILQFIPGTQGLINLQTPQTAGVVTYTAYRTSVSAGCGTATVGKGWNASSSAQYPLFQDTGNAGDGTSPPSAASVAKSCVGTVANPELYCAIAGVSTTPPLTCGAATPNGTTAGWDYVNTAATASPSHYHCYSGASSWTAGPF